MVAPVLGAAAGAAAYRAVQGAAEGMAQGGFGAALQRAVENVVQVQRSAVGASSRQKRMSACAQAAREARTRNSSAHIVFALGWQQLRSPQGRQAGGSPGPAPV